MRIRLEFTIIILVISVIVSTLVITNVYDRIKCDENGGEWIGSYGLGVRWIIKNAGKKEAFQLNVCQHLLDFLVQVDASFSD